VKIFVTGATGYIGGSVAERLVGSGQTVLGLVRSSKEPPLLKERGIDPIVGTLDDWNILSDAVQAADAVLHAANADHPSPEAFTVDLSPTAPLLAWHVLGCHR
jgi:uncharacterized protein YbjT (DUF2867 family)